MKKLNLIDLLKLKQRDRIFYYGMKHGKVFPYPDQLFDRLRPFNVGGFPASILFYIYFEIYHIIDVNYQND